MEQFEFSEKMNKLAAVRKELAAFGQDDLLKDNWQELENTLKQKDADECLRIAVCGQYSAGKSTLVHALTNDDTIAIGQDVTTDKVKEYNWNGLKIADTPGIYAGREDHDALSKEYIRKADLLIYMITIQGFTREIGNNFKSLVQGEYADKTMLLMNKRNQEPAENEPNWIRDTRDFLGGEEQLKKFYFTIVDIEDYLIGKKEHEDILVAESHFDEFIEKLNRFISERELMGKVTSRRNCIDGFLNLYIQDFSQKHERDEFTRRAKTALNDALRACDKAFHDASIRMRSGIKEMKNNLLGLLADETIQQFKTEADQMQLNLEILLNDQQLTNDLEEVVAQLKRDTDDIAVDASQYETRLADLARRFKGGNIDIGGTIDLGPLKTGMANLGEYLSTITKDTVKSIAKIIGHKFSWFGAGKCVKFLQGLGKLFGPLTTLVDFMQLATDQMHQQEMENKRKELANTFNEIEEGIQAELDKVKNGILTEDGESNASLYSSLKKELAKIEQQEEAQIQLQKHKEELLERLKDIQRKLATI